MKLSFTSLHTATNSWRIFMAVATFLEKRALKILCEKKKRKKKYINSKSQFSVTGDFDHLAHKTISLFRFRQNTLYIILLYFILIFFLIRKQRFTVTTPPILRVNVIKKKKNFFACWPMICVAQIPNSWFNTFGWESNAWLGTNHLTLPVFTPDFSRYPFRAGSTLAELTGSNHWPTHTN